jgi:hypothetical protein
VCLGARVGIVGGGEERVRWWPGNIVALEEGRLQELVFLKRTVDVANMILFSSIYFAGNPLSQSSKGSVPMTLRHDIWTDACYGTVNQRMESFLLSHLRLKIEFHSLSLV